jgi:hypothetical protein
MRKVTHILWIKQFFFCFFYSKKNYTFNYRYINKLKGVTKYELDENLNYLIYNHHAPVKEHRNREKFFNKLNKTEDKDIIKLINNMSKEKFLRRVFKKLKILK